MTLMSHYFTEKDMDRQERIRQLEVLISDAEQKILETNWELAKALGNLRHAKRMLPKFEELKN